MCRVSAYLGTEISLDEFLLRPPRNLIEQAIAPRELVYARVNGDGYGIGWYANDDAPAVYLNPAPIWTDPNLPYLARTLRSDLWLANVRSASKGNPVNHANTQPFHDREILFLHNGYIENFHLDIRPRIIDSITPESMALIRGNTDSEYLFALLHDMLDSDEDMSVDQALVALLARLDDWLEHREALLNFIVSDGGLIYAVRHAVNHASPSLYYSTDNALFPDGQIVASEALDEGDDWRAIPEHAILILDPDNPPDLTTL